MNPTFLLPAVQRVISSVEIRYEYSLKALQKLPHDPSLPRFRQPEDHVPTVSEHPDIMIDAPDTEPRLVDVDERAFQKALHENRFRTTVIVGELLDKTDDACRRRRLVEQVLHRLGDHPVWKAKDNPLINCPGAKAVPKRLSTEVLNRRWFIVPFAPRTVALFACIHDHHLPAPSFCKVEINDDFFNIFARLLKALSLVLGAVSLRSDSDHRAATHWHGPLVCPVALWSSWPLLF